MNSRGTRDRIFSSVIGGGVAGSGMTAAKAEQRRSAREKENAR
jgi:hypothetical protein